jgi:hypothetical protein
MNKKNSEDFIRFDEPHPHPLRSLTYHTEKILQKDAAIAVYV